MLFEVINPTWAKVEPSLIMKNEPTEVYENLRVSIPFHAYIFGADNVPDTEI